jgi:hypothetical protein
MPNSVMVFSHPNHEAALWATIRHRQPTLIFLTDGGGQDRVEQSRSALASLVQGGSVHFLNHPECTLYAALIRRDVAFFRALANQVALLIDGTEAVDVYCDSVEFYNPVHDICLPVVRAALPPTGARVFEVPLVHQTSMTPERYEFLRAPESLAAGAIWRNLSADDEQAKRDNIVSNYSILIRQLGATSVARALFHIGREQIFPARASLPEPAAGQVLRYEWRGQLLKQRGAVTEAIGFREHYLPIFAGLVP